MRRHLLRGRVRPSTSAEGEETSVFEFEAGSLERVFVAPAWLRDAGLVAWLLVGIVLVLCGLIALLALTNEIVIPVITGLLLASVASPIVAALQRRGMPRAAAAALILLAVVGLAVALGVVVLGGVTSQSDDISSQLHAATDRLTGWLHDLGVGSKAAADAQQNATTTTNDAGGLLLHGLATGIRELASLAVFLSFTALSLFFLLKDGPRLRSWVERHSGIPAGAAHIITGDMLTAMRGYFGGVTIVAAFSAVLVGGGALIIGVPLAGTIAIVTFLGGYVPYLGAWIAGAFAVLIALGGQGTEAAIAMAVIALLANGALQQMVQPIAFGATLSLHPLAVLIVTIGAGCLFGMIGLVLGAPVVSAIVHIAAHLGQARAAADEAAAGEAPEPPPAPA